MMFYCPEIEGVTSQNDMIRALMEAKNSQVSQYNKSTGVFKRFFDIFKKQCRDSYYYGNEYLFKYLASIPQDFNYKTIANWAAALGVTITNNTGDTTRTWRFMGGNALDFQAGFWWTVFTESGIYLVRPTKTGVFRGILDRSKVLKCAKKAQTSVHYSGETGYNFTIQARLDRMVPDTINSVLKTLALQKYKSDTLQFSGAADMDPGDYVVYDGVNWIVLSKKWDEIAREYIYSACSEVVETYTFAGPDLTPVVYLDTSTVDQATQAGKKIGIGVVPTASLHLPAGGTAANKAPLKWSQQLETELLATLEAYAMEMTPARLYLTRATLIREAIATVLFSQTATVTVANTATETTLVGAGQGSLSLPADFFSSITNGTCVGKTIRFHAGGWWGSKSSGGGTLTINIKYGSTVLISTGAFTPTAGVGSPYYGFWFLNAEITVRSIGSSGTAQGSGAYTQAQNPSGSNLNILGLYGLATINTTTANTLSITADWQTADTSNTIDCRVLTVEILN